MVYVHTNLRLIYRQREEWLKGKTNMWDVFLDDMGLNQGCWERGAGAGSGSGSGSGKRIFSKIAGSEAFSGAFFI